MMEARRQAYLEALGIEVWVPRPARPPADALCIGPGSGRRVLVCREPQESTTALAGDLLRYLGEDSAWAWPAGQRPGGDAGEVVGLREAVDRMLLTEIVIFGARLAERLTRREPPAVLGSARLLVAPDLDELAISAKARKNLWLKLNNPSF